SYKVSRPFNMATKAEISDLAQDFINFILSAQGQAVVEDHGYISQGNNGDFTSNGATGKIVVGGSSSVTPVMEKLKEAYAAVNPDVEIEVQQSDSTTGMTSAIDGVCDIGMASRELKDTETAELTATVIAQDGIAVVVNNNNPIDNLTKDQVKSIYVGETTSWSEVE
ncbi:MAG: phosphate ABC transporter substrate-binding protein, partial [Lachnospiraceae bacterium]|nr:phosphate ABC transporter substrate-binding protein [Lachnospiraceae bacterium]